jgi:actin-like ATPase involved in cell morphogenesis
MYGASNDFSIETFAPQLRDSAYWVGFNNILRRIEFNCGLAYGTLSDANEKEMTATEIISSKQRFYITISTIRDILKELISEIVENVATLSSVLNFGLVKTDYTLDFDIEDGILTTTKEPSVLKEFTKTIPTVAIAITTTARIISFLIFLLILTNLIVSKINWF